MKIATWNVNSIRQRLGHVTTWLQKENPDILFLQELKGEDFPAEAFPGWHLLLRGQKAYNGVAILARTPLAKVLDALPGDPEDAQARYLEAECGGVRLVNLYLPNGNPIGTDKFTYKLDWMERLYQRLCSLRAERVPFLVGGDFNVIPEARDCYDPAVWSQDALFHPESRRRFNRLLGLGLTDAFRALNQDSHQYTFWDYQGGAWPQDQGIRIDHFLLSPPITDRLKSCTIDRAPRGWDKASDHTPVLLEII